MVKYAFKFFILLIVLSSCSLSHEKPIDKPWVFDKQITADSLENRVKNLENEVAELKLDRAQIDQEYNLQLPVAQKENAIIPPITDIALNLSTLPSIGIRFGVHDGKTRIVLDLPHAVKFSTDLDNAEKFFLIELESTGLNLKDGDNPPTSSLISSYNVETDNQGVTRIIFHLKTSSASIITKALLQPSGQYGHRIFVDLGAN